MSTNPLKQFSRLSPTIHLFTPLSYKTGQLIVLFSWMQAADKHIAKYIHFHRTHFPTAKILLIKSTLVNNNTPYSILQKSLQPAIDVVLGVLGDCRYDSTQSHQQQQQQHQQQQATAAVYPHIMLHIFSTGGMNMATQVLTALNRQLKAPAPVVGIVCDSAPACGSYANSYTAATSTFSAGFPLSILIKLVAKHKFPLLVATVKRCSRVFRLRRVAINPPSMPWYVCVFFSLWFGQVKRM